jgi:mono/diheme cytochrome c family protein
MRRATPFLAGLLLAALVSARTAGQPGGTTAPSPVEHFNYGSFGGEENDGLPYWIWQALPKICPDQLGGAGYAAIGAVWEPGRELPIGFTKKARFGGDRVAVNCAFCHTATYRSSPEARTVIVPGGPSTRTSPQAYFRFLQGCIGGDDFTTDKVLAAIDQMTTLSWTDRLLMRTLIIPATRKGLARRAKDMAWSERQPDWGPGRVDPFNPLKVGMLKQEPDNTVGASDMVPLWNMASRDGTAQHWDGVNQSLHELMLSSGLANGASLKSIELESLAEMERWIRAVPPPKYPFAVDQAAATRGAAIFARDCASCHASGAARTATVIPVTEVGTDRHRLDSFTPQIAEGIAQFTRGTKAAISGFRKTNGYVAVPLGGVWLRAPYLHNGSVPTLAALLSPPAERPARFVRGYDVIDQAGVGFVSSGPEATKAGVVFDTSKPGNGNRGHLYGTALGAADRTALIEFLKTQ